MEKFKSINISWSQGGYGCEDRISETIKIKEYEFCFKRTVDKVMEGSTKTLLKLNVFDVDEKLINQVETECEYLLLNKECLESNICDDGSMVCIEITMLDDKKFKLSFCEDYMNHMVEGLNLAIKKILNKAKIRLSFLKFLPLPKSK